MISEIKISNYRSLGQDVKISNLGPLVVFTGRNGSGKSNILDALKFVSDTIRLGLDGAITERQGIKSIRRWSSGKPVDIHIALAINEEKFSGTYEFRISSHKTYEYIVKSESAHVTSKEGQTSHFSRSENQWLNKPKNINPSLEPMALILPILSGESNFKLLADFLKGIAIYNIFPDQLKEPHKYNPVRPMDKHGSNWISILKDQDKATWEGDLVSALNKLTNDIDEFRIQQLSGFLMPSFRHGKGTGESEKGRWFGAHLESDGTLRLAGILTALLQTPKLSVIGIEEPELTVHPGAINLIFDFIRQASRQSQIFLTTHSPELLDCLKDPKMVWVVEKVNQFTLVDSVAEDQLEAIKSKLQSIGEIHRTEGLRGGMQLRLFEDSL